MFNLKSFILSSLILIFAGLLYGQHVPSRERGDVTKERKAQMEGNQIRTSVYNTGVTGRTSGNFPITEHTPYEWPKNTGRVYLANNAIAIGAEVTDEQGAKQSIISRPFWETSPDGRSWHFEPVPGYFNEQTEEGFATSTDPNTWPESWPDKASDENDPGWSGKWNGYFGKDVFNADQELFYHASDDNYDRFLYYPDTTDLTRKGLGLILDARVLAWSQILVQDALFVLYKIKNDGTKPLNKVGITICWADFVGGDGDSEDDLTEFDLLNDIAWSRDSDNRSPAAAFGSNPVGIVGGAFLETPGNSVDRIDNDGDGETGGPKVTDAMLVGESDPSIPLGDPRRFDGIDNNGNGLIDENTTHIAFEEQVGVSYADGVDQNGDAEAGSPVVTQSMVDQAAGDIWRRWPANPETDAVQGGLIHLVMLDAGDVGRGFADNIDNSDNGEEGSPVVTQEIITQAAADPYFRYKVPGSTVILYDVKAEDLGKKYADGIDNDNNGAIDEFVDEGIDEMIDESRNDGIDNDNDWNALTDDVGLDGVIDTGDEGEGDGKPTSGAGTTLPGEPNTDVTDVSETDQIGLTGSYYTDSGWIDTFEDLFIWNQFMIPGNYVGQPIPDEYNLFVSSGLFSLQPGQTEPVSMAIILANGPVIDPDGQIRKQAVLEKKGRAQEVYDNDYQFANAPLVPKLTAVPGDNKVTLYWDDAAEKSVDKFIGNIGGNPNDFEGYKIYRSSDPSFLDPLEITNAEGIPTFKIPLAVFDLEDGIRGYDSLGFEGVHYNLGFDTGLQHSWTDSSVKNGFSYYYAIVSYDQGYPFGGITPAESRISISLNTDGSVKSLSKNVVYVTPEASSAGYVEPTLGEVNRILGSTTSRVSYEIIDPNDIKDGHVYYITFQDTIKKGPPDTLTTKNYTLVDSTSNIILVDKGTDFDPAIEKPIIDGFKLSFANESSVGVNRATSGWSDPLNTPFLIEKFVQDPPGQQGEQKTSDYKVIFGDAGYDTSTAFIYNGRNWPSIPVNFKVFNVSENKFIDFGFIEPDLTNSPAGTFSSNGGSRQDRIVFLEAKLNNPNLLPTWWFYLARKDSGAVHKIPATGDTATVNIMKPFLSPDVFRFVAQKGHIDMEKAKDDLTKIKVVPNPYLANAQWEPKNPYVSGRGPRAIHFTHLPSKCTIRIFTVNGELVQEIEHDSNMIDGTAEWDLLTKDRLSASYGIYIYHIDAPGVGTTAGKFAIIK